MARRGRPTAYRKENVEIVYRLALLNIDEKRMASVFGVQETTFNNWKKAHPDFLQSLKDGRENADSKVAKSLFERATGYTGKEVKAFFDKSTGTIITKEIPKYYPPDPTSMIFFLKNKQRLIWKDRHQDQEETDELAKALTDIIKNLGVNLPG